MTRMAGSGEGEERPRQTAALQGGPQRPDQDTEGAAPARVAQRHVSLLVRPRIQSGGGRWQDQEAGNGLFSAKVHPAPSPRERLWGAEGGRRRTDQGGGQGRGALLGAATHLCS